MKFLSSLFVVILLLGVGFLLFQTSIVPLYSQEKSINKSLIFVEKFSFEDRKDAFIARLQYWFRADDSFTTASGNTMTSSGISF
ncbi:MAG: hypothetical protein ACK4NC_04630 [Candidatus Gracilibacteria bacterium]